MIEIKFFWCAWCCGQGLEKVKNKIVQLNLKGQSSSMSKKGWKDAQGRSGKVSLSHAKLSNSTPQIVCWKRQGLSTI